MPSEQHTPVLVGGARTPVGRLGGGLSGVDAIDLGAHAVRAALARCPGLEPDYIAMGNVLQAANGQNPARQAAVRGGVATTVPAITLNDVCLSSMTSVAIAASMIREGEAATVLVGGFESMSRAPHAVRMRGAPRVGDAELVDVMVHDGLWCAFAEQGMGALSDAENARLGVTRAEQDAVALASHERAAAGSDDGSLEDEIVPLAGLAADEGIRRDTSAERLAALAAAFGADGTITAGNASQLSDAGAAGLVTSRALAADAGLEPIVEILGRAVVAGPGPTLHEKPAAAAARLLAGHALTAADVDVWEVNEAFAGVIVATVRALDIPLERVNVNGGAIAIGHPLAASGFRLVLTLARELRRRGGGVGVAAICGGGGQGQAILLRAA